MRAVNLIPADARRRSRSSSGGDGLSVRSFGPGHVAVLLVAVVVALILLRVLADNTVKDRRATLAAVQSEVAQEQAEAAKLTFYTNFVQSAQAREQEVEDVADQRFAWKRAFDQLGHVLPASTSLNNIVATPGSAVAGTTTTPTVSTGPTFALTGCIDTPNQNGVATVLRRLTQVTGVSGVNFGSSTRQTNCGNSFNISLAFAAAATSVVTPTNGSSSVVGTATTTTSTTSSPTPSTVTTG